MLYVFNVSLNKHICSCAVIDALAIGIVVGNAAFQCRDHEFCSSQKAVHIAKRSVHCISWVCKHKG